MKKSFFLISFFFVIVLMLENCKPQPVNKPANTDPDSLYVGVKYTIAVPNLFPPVSNRYADSMTYEGVALGRRLFYDKHLSSDGQISCASCHRISHSFADTVALSTGVFGQTFRNSLVLVNLAWSTSYDYDGREATLALQAQDALHSNMGMLADSAIAHLQKDTVYVKLFKKAFGRPGTITEAGIYKALQQFVMTIISANSRFDQYRQTFTGLSQSELRGYTLFNSETGDCFHCHMSEAGYTLLMTDNLFRNNGLDSALTIYDFKDPGRGGVTLNASDYGLFKDATLRNIAVTGPYMHDGRYTTLTQVVNFYNDSTHNSPTEDPLMLLVNHNYGRGLHLAPSQVTDIVNFMNTLTDTSFLDNPNLANPF